MAGIGLRCVMALQFLLVLVVQIASANDFQPSSWQEWIFWKLGWFPEWGEGAIAIPTSMGPLQAWTFGSLNRSSSDKVALTIHGGMDIDHIHHDFDEIAANLSATRGYFVISPNFHAMRKSSPGRMNAQQLTGLMEDILRWAGVKKFEMVLGKGWGGAMAARASVLKSELVERLVMIAPGPLREDYHRDGNLSITVPAMLLYNVDDASVDNHVMHAIRMNTPNIRSGYQWHYRGGHKMLKAYTTDITRFANMNIKPKQVEEEKPDAPAHAPIHAEL